MFELRITHSYYGHTEVCDTSDNWDEIHAQALTLIAACKANIIIHIETVSIARGNETFTMWTNTLNDKCPACRDDHRPCKCGLL